MSKVLKIVKQFDRGQCLASIKRIGFSHQDDCPFCQLRIQMAWLVTLYAKQAMTKHYPQDYEIVAEDIQDILLTALHNVGIDPALFNSRFKD